MVSVDSGENFAKFKLFNNFNKGIDMHSTRECYNTTLQSHTIGKKIYSESKHSISVSHHYLIKNKPAIWMSLEIIVALICIFCLSVEATKYKSTIYSWKKKKINMAASVESMEQYWDKNPEKEN